MIKKVSIEKAIKSLPRESVVAVGIAYGDEAQSAKLIEELEKNVDEYNNFINALFENQNILGFFEKNHYVEYGAIENAFCGAVPEIVKRNWNKNRVFEIPYRFLDNCLYDVEKAKVYSLTNAEGKKVKSLFPGTFGGHDKLKIYGKLDCKSAARHIREGNYVKHRVFFIDEQTAIAAGYRPCAVCMPEEYRKWKDIQNSK